MFNLCLKFIVITHAIEMFISVVIAFFAIAVILLLTISGWLESRKNIGRNDV